MSLSKLGDEGKVALSEFSLEGSHKAELRQARNKGLRHGATFEIIAATQVPDIMPR